MPVRCTDADPAHPVMAKAGPPGAICENAATTTNSSAAKVSDAVAPANEPAVATAIVDPATRLAATADHADLVTKPAVPVPAASVLTSKQMPPKMSRAKPQPAKSSLPSRSGH